MNNKINRVLSILEKKSRLEKTRKINVVPEDRMLAITEDTGKFFNILLKSSKAKSILEIGTSTGYSTLWFADAVIKNSPNNCNIITIEENPSKIKRAISNFEDASVLKYIKIKQGNALAVLRKLSKENKMQKFDFVFIDADKENIIKYFDLVFPMVKIGGIVAADNILYPTKYRKHMKKYSKHIQAKTNVQTITIPIGNGEELSIKTSN